MLTNTDVQKLAKLSRLHLSDTEVEAFRDQIGSILAYVDKLQEVNTDDVPELQHAQNLVNVFREDVVDCDFDIRNRAIALFPEKSGDLLEVQAVFESRTE